MVSELVALVLTVQTDVVHLRAVWVCIVLSEAFFILDHPQDAKRMIGKRLLVLVLNAIRFDGVQSCGDTRHSQSLATGAPLCQALMHNTYGCNSRSPEVEVQEENDRGRVIVHCEDHHANEAQRPKPVYEPFWARDALAPSYLDAHSQKSSMMSNSMSQFCWYPAVVND